MARAPTPGKGAGSSGLATFTAVAIGQVFSLLGSGMTGFALVIWAYAETGQATTLALAAFFRFGPTVLFSPTAGALVDRWNRKLTMMLSDLAAGISTIALLLLLLGSSLEVWQWYLAGAIAGVFEAFQFPAYSAAISTMLPKQHYGRAAGMLSLAQNASSIFAPIAAGALIGIFALPGNIDRALVVIMGADIVTFTIAIGILLAVRIPQSPRTDLGTRARGNLLKESVFGFHYIAKRKSLLGLQLVFFFVNLFATLGFIVVAPMILARTSQDAVVLGIVESAAGLGGVIGSIAMSAWGGPKRRIHGVLAGMALVGVAGEVLTGLGRELVIWSAAAFLTSFLLPIINGSNQAIWQSKVAPDIQGKVFAVRRLIAQITVPVAFLIAGPLADFVFEPAMAAGGSLAGTFGFLVGVGPGAGMAFMLVVFGLMDALVGIGAYSMRTVRDVEAILPDFDAVPAAAADGGSPPKG